ncbi:MAG: GNAT family N-acetyltransferase [Thermomicrobiales bacterium]
MTKSTPAPTSTHSIREVFGDDIYTLSRAIADYAFGATPEKQDPEKDAKRTAELIKYGAASRFFVAFSGDQPQATTAIHKMTGNVRGKVLPMGGIGAVASMPAGRRQGHVRQLFIRAFEEMRNDGYIASTLYPFRESFYERLGYATFPAPRYVTLNPAHLASIVRTPKAGSVEQVPMSSGWETWREFIEGYQRTTHGFALRDASSDIQNRDDNTWWVAFARDERGEIIGTMQFRITGYEKRIETIPYFTSALGKYLLLDWIGRHVDQVKEASIRVSPTEYADLWSHDLKATTSTADDTAWSSPQARIISIEGLTGIGAGDGEISVQIIDDYAHWNAGIYTFTGRNGALTVTPDGDAAAAATLTIQGLASLIYSGQDPADFIYRGWGDVDEAARQTLRSLFPVATPILHEEF